MCFDQRASKRSDLMACEPGELVELKDVCIDTSLPVRQRMEGFLEQVRNPYLFKVDDITVKLEFSSGKSLEDSLLSFLLAEKNR